MGIENAELSRRELLQIIIPGSWLPDVIKKRTLSPVSKGSLVVDLATIPLLAGACSSPSRTPVAQLPVRVSPTEPASFVDTETGRLGLLQELEALPPSPIRTLLHERVKPLYLETPPKTINRAGLEIRVFNPKVRLAQTPPSIYGIFTARPKESTPTGEGPFRPFGRAIRRIPYPHLVLDKERSRFNPGDFASDGTLLIEVTIDTNILVQDGIWPLIDIKAPPASYSSLEQKTLAESITRFAYIKEACTHLTYDLYVEEIVRKMSSLGLDPQIEVLKPDNSIGKIEVVTGFITNINNSNHGRLEAALDLAGYLLAFKAVEGSDNSPQGFAKQSARLRTLDLGDNAQDILSNSLKWVLTSPDASGLIHVGALERIP